MCITTQLHLLANEQNDKIWFREDQRGSAHGEQYAHGAAYSLILSVGALRSPNTLVKKDLEGT